MENHHKLHIQDFISRHENWKELLSEKPYHLMIQETEHLVLFRYYLDSDFSLPVCREARGLILEKGTWNVVRIAFDKFFEYGEHYADEIDWETSSATRKEDGTLISLYWYRDKWNIATTGNISAETAPVRNDTEYTAFQKLAETAFQKYHLDYERLDKECTYTFELCSLHNQVICRYPEIRLFHILTRNNRTLKETDTEIGIPKPEQYHCSSLKEYQSLVKNFPKNTEGIVIKDGQNHRLKLKTFMYHQLHRIMSKGVLQQKQALTMVRNQNYQEFLSYFPEYRSLFAELQSLADRIPVLESEIISDTEKWKQDNPNADRKEFARSLTRYKPLYFKAYDNELHEYLLSCRQKDYERLIDEIKTHSLRNGKD